MFQRSPAGLLVAAASFLAVTAYFVLVVWVQPRASAVEVSEPDPGHRWILGPSAEDLSATADRGVEEALEMLNDRSLAPSDRIRGFKERLRHSESFLVRSLRAQPAQASALAQLAAVRRELDPPLTADSRRPHLAMIALASEMAPTVPSVQIKLGELLLKMGRREEAQEYLHRAVELEPRSSAEVVSLLRDDLVPPDEILAVLPRRPETFATLQRAFFDMGMEAEYLEAADGLLTEPASDLAPQVLAAYGNASLRIGRPDRLLERMERLAAFEAADLEAERQRQLSRARLKLGETDEAVQHARLARELQPDSDSLVQHLGDILLAAGDPAAAVQAYRDALGIVARGSGDPLLRARLYSKIGRAEERQGAVDRAYDAYRLALGLDPEERQARERLDAMNRAAGLDPEDRER